MRQLNDNDFVAWLEYSSIRRMLELTGADETDGRKPHRTAQGKPVVRRGRKARGLARTARRPSCQTKQRW